MPVRSDAGAAARSRLDDGIPYADHCDRVIDSPWELKDRGSG